MFFLNRAFKESLNITATAGGLNLLSPQGLNNNDRVVTDMKEKFKVAQLALEKGFDRYQVDNGLYRLNSND